MTRALRTFSAVAVAALLPFACGDDDAGDAGGEVDVLPTEEFIERARDICLETYETANEAYDKFFDDHSDVDFEEFSDVPEDVLEELAALAATFYDDVIADLRKTAPEGDEDEWSDLLNDYENIVNAIQDDPKSVLTASEDPTGELEERFDALGVRECSG